MRLRMGIRFQMKLTTVGLLLALLPGVSCAQSAEAPASVAVPPASGTPEPIPAPAPAAATPVVVRIEILEEISSARNKRGDTFALQLADAVTLPDGRVLPASTHGQGEVIHADKSGVGGKPGELILAARFLEVPEGRLRLHALRLSGAGKAHNGAAVGASVVAEAVVPGQACSPCSFAEASTSFLLEPKEPPNWMSCPCRSSTRTAPIAASQPRRKTHSECSSQGLSDSRTWSCRRHGTGAGRHPVCGHASSCGSCCGCHGCRRDTCGHA